MKKNNPTNKNSNYCPDNKSNKSSNPTSKKNPTSEIPSSDNKKKFDAPEMFKDSDYRN